MGQDIIKADDWIPAIMPILESGKEVKTKPQGLSMFPFIMGGRDEVFLKKIDRDLKRGDIVLYRRVNGVYVLHRVHHVGEAGLFMLGDSQQEIEGPVSRSQCVAMVERYYRKGVLKDNDSFFVRVQYTVWMWARPIRRIAINVNALRRKVFKG